MNERNYSLNQRISLYYFDDSAHYANFKYSYIMHQIKLLELRFFLSLTLNNKHNNIASLHTKIAYKSWCK